MFFITIWHTGTHTFMQELKKIEGFEHRHCTTEEHYKKSEQAEVLATSFRDPYRIAASWKNREELVDFQWKRQWDIYAKVLKLNPIIFYCDGPQEQHGFKFGPKQNARKDKHLVHKALDEGNMKRYHQKIAPYLIDYAFNAIEPYRDKLYG